MVRAQVEATKQYQATSTGASPLSATCSPAPAGSVTRRGVLRSVRCVGVGALTGMALLAACGGERPAVAPATSKLQGKLTIWGAPGDGANWDNDFGHQMVSEFQSAYPGVTIETASTGPQGGNPADEKFLVAASGGTPPDLYSTGRSAVADWGIDGVVQALDARIKQSAVVKPEKFLPHMIEEGSWKGKVYGLFHSVDARALFWNKDLYLQAGLDPEKPPDTWDDFLSAVTKTLRRDGSELKVLGYHPTMNSVGGAFWLAWLWALGGSVLTDDKEHVAFNSEQGVKALEWMQRLTNAQGGWNAIDQLATQLQQTSSAKGTGWLFRIKGVAHYFEVGDLERLLTLENADVHFGIGPAPKAPTGKRASVRGGFQLVMAAGAKNPDAAWAFIEWHLGKDRQVQWNDYWNRIPTTTEAANSPAYLKDHPSRKVFIEVAAYSQRQPAITPGLAEIKDLVQQIPITVLSGKQSPKDALADAARDVQNVLDRWKGR